MLYFSGYYLCSLLCLRSIHLSVKERWTLPVNSDWMVSQHMLRIFWVWKVSTLHLHHILLRCSSESQLARLKFLHGWQQTKQTYWAASRCEYTVSVCFHWDIGWFLKATCKKKQPIPDGKYAVMFVHHTNWETKTNTMFWFLPYRARPLGTVC